MQATNRDGTRPQARTLRVIAHPTTADNADMREAIAYIRARGHHVQVQTPSGVEAATHCAMEAVQAGVDAVVAAGGDGTLNTIVNGVAQTNQGQACAVGVLPMGTANDFATACGIPTDDAVAALLLIAEGTAQPIDLGVVGQRVFVNVASGGTGTQITVETSPEIKEILGAAAYLLTGLREMRTINAQHAHITGPNLHWEGAFYALAIGNGRQAGGGFQVCPHALLDDGLLDMLIIPEMPLAQLLIVLAQLRQGTQITNEQVIYHQVQINLDGEPFSTTPTFRIRERALPMYLPPTAPLQGRHNGRHLQGFQHDR